MNLEKRQKLSNTWKQLVGDYVKETIELLDRGYTHGWENISDLPEDKSHKIAEDVVSLLREANKNRTQIQFRKEFPTSHASFVPTLDDRCTTIDNICLLPDGRILMKSGCLSLIENNIISDLPEFYDAKLCPNRRYLALSKKDCIEIYDGYEGPLKTSISLEREPGNLSKKILDGIERAPITTYSKIYAVFPCGGKVLLGTDDAFYIFSATSCDLLYPTVLELNEYLEENTTELYDLDMQHACISPDGEYIAMGHQCSDHYIFDSKLKLATTVSTASSYPHFSCFSKDGQLLALNSCHFYHGETIGVLTASLKKGTQQGFSNIPYLEDTTFPRGTRLLEDLYRVYAAVPYKEGFILGNAQGEIAYIDENSQRRWWYRIGSTVSAIDISKDEKTLIVSTYAGFLCILDLDSGTLDPYAITNAKIAEKQRWIFWRGEESPLLW